MSTHPTAPLATVKTAATDVKTSDFHKNLFQPANFRPKTPKPRPQPTAHPKRFPLPTPQKPR